MRPEAYRLAKATLSPTSPQHQHEALLAAQAVHVTNTEWLRARLSVSANISATEAHEGNGYRHQYVKPEAYRLAKATLSPTSPHDQHEALLAAQAIPLPMAV